MHLIIKFLLILIFFIKSLNDKINRWYKSTHKCQLCKEIEDFKYLRIEKPKELKNSVQMSSAT